MVSLPNCESRRWGLHAHRKNRNGRFLISRGHSALLRAGAIATERQKRLWYTPEGVEHILRNQALKRQIEPDEVARLVLFLAAEDSSAITNQSYVVDGGWV